MARPLRIELAGGLYHVTSRGNQRQSIFLTDDDRQMWLDIFGSVCKRFNWVCHAWCQMTNHYHIVVETIEGNLSQGMRQLNGVYTQRFNRMHHRVGHVFQGRYRAIIIEKDSYLLELIRYVVLNPVRAGMVTDAVDWPWSSYDAMVGVSVPPEWLERHWILKQFGDTRGEAVNGYIEFVLAGRGQADFWDAVKGQIYLGSEPFIEQLQKSIADHSKITEIPRAQRRPLARPLKEYRDCFADAKEGMVAAHATGDYSMNDIGRCFGVHYSTVSRAIKGAEQNMLDCKT